MTLTELLGDFMDGADSRPLSDPMTLWFPPGTKARYEKLQAQSSRRFVKRLREVVLMAIELAEERAG